MNTAWLLLFLPLAAMTGWWFASRKAPQQYARSTDTDQHYLIQLNHLLTDEDDEALVEFLSLMDQQIKSVELQIILGSLCRRKGEYERASLIHQAILNNTKHAAQTRARAKFELAQDYQAAGWLDRAESLYVDLLEDPKYQLEIANHLLKIYQHQNDWASAIQTANYLREHKLWSDTLSEKLAHFYCELCEQCIKTGRFPDAEKYLNEAEKIEPNGPRVIILFGRMAAFKGDHSKAVHTWKRLLIVAPESVGLVIVHMRESFKMIDDHKAYIRFLKQAVEASDDPNILTALLEALKFDHEQSAGQFLIKHLKEKPSLVGLKQILLNWQDVPSQISHDELLYIVETMTTLIQAENRFQCTKCGYTANEFDWSCPSCQSWGNFQRNTISLQNRTYPSKVKEISVQDSSVQQNLTQT